MGPEDFDKEDSKPSSFDDNNLTDHEEAESSRAFNTKSAKPPKDANLNTETFKEIVEPILKPQSNKNARSHNPHRDKPEITEPILRPTLAPFRIEASTKNDFLSKLTNNQQISYNFYNVGEDEWVPSLAKSKDGKWKREDGSKSIKTEDSPLEAIAMTVQFLPQRLARVFEQAEKYTRETILPLVSTYTPKFISDFIIPKPSPKYVPLVYDETSTASVRRNLDEARQFNPPPVKSTSSTTEKITTTIYTHIQKIAKKRTTTIITTTTTTQSPDAINVEQVARKTRDESQARKNIFDMKLSAIADDIVLSTTEKNKGIYIDLPVFDTTPRLKYIPLENVTK